MKLANSWGLPPMYPAWGQRQYGDATFGMAFQKSSGLIGSQTKAEGGSVEILDHGDPEEIRLFTRLRSACASKGARIFASLSK